MNQLFSDGVVRNMRYRGTREDIPCRRRFRYRNAKELAALQAENKRLREVLAVFEGGKAKVATA